MHKTIMFSRKPDEKFTIHGIIDIIDLLTPRWFTENVLEDTRKDLNFQDTACLAIEQKIVSFIMFTSWEGTLYITLMATHPDYQNQGYGSELVSVFFEHARTIEFKEIKLLTVPQEVKPIYETTISFYKRHGFYISKRFTEIWGSGAIELTKILE